MQDEHVAVRVVEERHVAHPGVERLAEEFDDELRSLGASPSTPP
jgi:hypothetical protein